MGLRQRFCTGALILFSFVMLTGCFGKETPDPAESAPLETTEPTPTPEPPTPTPAEPMMDNDIILSFFPNNTFIKLDATHYSDLSRGDTVSIDTVLAGANNINLVILKKESNFPALGFITYFSALMDYSNQEIVSEVLAIPEKEPDVDTLTPLPVVSGSYIPIHQNDTFSLLISVCQTDTNDKESYTAGLWTLQNGKWNMLWPSEAYGTEAYSVYWQDRKSEISSSGVTLYTRAPEPSESPDLPEPSESPAPSGQTGETWVFEKTLSMETLLP